MLLITQAWSGLDGKMEHMFERLNKVPEVAHTKEDLEAIMEDACELCTGLSEYEYGKLSGLDTLDLVEGLDELDGFDEAVEGQSKVWSPRVRCSPGQPRVEPPGETPRVT